MADHIGETICGALTSDGKDCPGPIPPDAPVNMCTHHMIKAYEYIASRIADAEGRPYAFAEIQGPSTSFVYYLSHDGMIKIGTTRSLWSRMNQIGGGTLLAIEPGDRDTEQERHKQFAEYRIGRNSEWFDRHQALERHVIALRQRYGDPVARRYENGRLRPLWRLLDNQVAK